MSDLEPATHPKKPVRATASRTGLGQRREFLILVPASLLILVMLSTFTLLAFRNALDLERGEKHREAVRIARLIGSRLRPGALPSASELRLLAGGRVEVAIFDADGTVLRASAEADAEALESLGFVTGIAGAEVGGRSLSVQVGLPARALARSRAGLKVLLPVVLITDVAVMVLIFIYAQHFLAPLEQLVERARRVREPDPAGEDEVSYLLETFDKALAALSKPPAGDDLEAIERTLGQSFDSGALLCDAGGTVIALNDTGRELLALAKPRLGRPVHELLAARPPLGELMERAIVEGRAVQRAECTFQVADAADRKERTIGLSVHVLRRDDGVVRGYLALFVDLTAVRRRAREQQLAETLHELGQVAAGVAHELRNSVATLRGYLTLVDRAGDAESIADYAQEIRRETDHLSRVVDDFLAFARPGTAHTEPVDLAELAERTASDPALGDARVAVLFAAPTEPSSYTVVGDRQLLERALRNLLSNAVEAEREIGSPCGVEIHLSHAEDQVEIEVVDRGHGMAPEIAERLFHPFVTGKVGGVGLGLALCLRIVHLHHGTLTLTPRPGGGTSARMCFPTG